MAFLWVEKVNRSKWLTVELTGDTWVLSTGEPTVLCECNCGGSIFRPTLLIRRSRAASALWILLAGEEANVRGNGLPMASAVHELRDRDEIRLGDAETGAWQRCFFSTAGAVRVEPFPAGGDPLHCPHCRQPIAGGQPAVRCPACGRWHHELGNGQRCWSLAGRCARCRCPAPLDGDPDVTRE